VVTFDATGVSLSKMFNDCWMTDHGSGRPHMTYDLCRRFAEAVVSLSPDDPLTVAYGRMPLTSQLPVGRDADRGIVDESDLPLAGDNPRAQRRRPVHDQPPRRSHADQRLLTIRRAVAPCR
jgi:hypothetical protein